MKKDKNFDLIEFIKEKLKELDMDQLVILNALVFAELGDCYFKNKGKNSCSTTDLT